MSTSISIPFLHPSLLGIASVIGILVMVALPADRRRPWYALGACLATVMAVTISGLLPLTGELMLSAWGMALAAAFIVAFFTADRRARALGLPRPFVGELLMVSCVCGIVGCRIKWLIDFWPTWAQSPDGSQLPWRELLPIAFNLDGGGAVLYGGLILGAFGGWLVCRHHRMRLAVVGDLAAPAVLLAIACGRVGCYFNGCTWGTATTLPWGIAPSPQACTLGCSSTESLHPTALYEALATLIMGLALGWWWRRRNALVVTSSTKITNAVGTAPRATVGTRAPAMTVTPDPAPGAIAVTAVAGYAAWRFLIEFLRGDTNLQVLGSFHGFFPATSSQVVSLYVLICVVGWSGVRWLQRRGRTLS